MSPLNKLQKFAELLRFSNVYENFDAKAPELLGENGVSVQLKGRWAEGHFGNNNPIVLELACGKGHYTLGLAQRFPNKNFIGVDIKGARIWKGAKGALDQGLHNAAFLRTRIEQITHFFAPAEISEIWITFPDPFLRKSKANRRLTCARFLDRYRQLLQPAGLIHLKTDSPALYEFTLETLGEYADSQILYQDDDIYSKPLPDEVLSIKTYYELMHLEAGKTIKYVKFVI
ncbi:MAG: tRNA (guanosine(46)-N7)-methyltransferase TrmB [Bacteroidota bacterium]